MTEALIILFFLTIPAAVLWLCGKVGILGKLGPILILYIIGVIFGNLVHDESMGKIQEVITGFTVPMAIPLLLFGCTFSRSRARSQLLALVTGLAAVVAAVIIGYLLFGRRIPDGALIGGMLSGAYTGGTVNMAALKVMLGVSDTNFVLLNSYDMLVCFFYLTFLMVFGVKLFRKWLPCDAPVVDKAGILKAEERMSEGNFRALFTKKGMRGAAVLVGIDVIMVGIAAGIALLAGKEAFLPVFILVLTSLGIAASFWKPVKSRRGGNEIGMYLIFIFSVTVASMADLSKFSLGDNVLALAYLTFIIFGSLAMQVVMARIFRIDSDIMVISSVSYICSPPFVPMIAASMKNKNVLAAGLAIGVVGYAVGNYLGFAMAKLLALL